MDNLTNPNANFFQPGQGGNPLSNVPLNTTPTTTNLAFPTATTLTSSQLNTPPVSSTPLVPTTNASAFVGSLPIQTPEQQQPELQQRINELTRQLGGQTQDVMGLQAQAGLPDQTRLLADANLKLAQMQREFQLAEQQASQSGETLGFAQGRSQQVRQQAAIELGAQAARVQALQGNIETANQIITNTINQKYAPIQNQLNFLVRNLEMNMENMDRAEKKRAQLQIENFRQQELNLERQKLNETTNARLQNLVTAGVVPQYNGEFGATIDIVSNLETTVAGKNAVRSQLQNAIANKDYTTAYNQIANTVEGNLVGEAKQRFANARTDYQVMSGMRDAINAYANAGGNMGLLKGTAEEIERKLGQVTDPRFATLAVQLQREFQTYRNTMTGAAFSPEESREYASVNPTSNKTLNLNLSVIDGAMKQLENRVTKTIETRVPSAKFIYEQVKSPTPQAPQAPQAQLTPGSTGTTSSGMPFKIIGGTTAPAPTAPTTPTVPTVTPQFTAPQVAPQQSMSNVSNLFSGYKGFNIGNLYK